MRVAALYDLHANLPALEAVLSDVRREKPDLLVIGGDVLPGPMPRETLDMLEALDLPTHFLLGNGERELLGLLDGVDSTVIPAAYRESMRWNAEQIRGRHEAFVRRWPRDVRATIESLGSVLFCHATPRNDFEIFTRETDAAVLAPIFAETRASLVVCGHTHMQFDRRIGSVRVINAGSAGMPFAAPGAYWLLLGPGVELRRTLYDFEAAARRIRATAYPTAAEFADRNVLSPPAEREMLDLYRRAELRR